MYSILCICNVQYDARLSKFSLELISGPLKVQFGIKKGVHSTLLKTLSLPNLKLKSMKLTTYQLMTILIHVAFKMLLLNTSLKF
jgi:hypothetical protein